MILEKHGTDTSVSEVTSVGSHGFWLLINAFLCAFAGLVATNMVEDQES